MNDTRREGQEQAFLLEVAPEPRYVALARIFAAAVARHFDCAEEQVQDVKVAISEACSNSVKAHRKAGLDDPVRVSVALGSRILRYEVADAGPGLELDSPFRSLPPDPGELTESGVGLTLIRALFPDVEFGPNDRSGTSVRFSVSAHAHDPYARPRQR